MENLMGGGHFQDKWENIMERDPRKSSNCFGELMLEKHQQEFIHLVNTKENLVVKMYLVDNEKILFICFSEQTVIAFLNTIHRINICNGAVICSSSGRSLMSEIF